MKTNLSKYRRILLIFIFLILFTFKGFSQANNYNCYIKNINQITPSTLEFDIFIEWTGTNIQKLTFFQAGINFNYSGMSNGGTITGAFKSGSADPGVSIIQQAPNWNINTSSKQIRMLAAIASPSSFAATIPGPPGFRLGTFAMSNTVPFTSLATPNFVWSFLTGTGTITKTEVAVYVNGSTAGTDITIPASHFVEGNPVCPTVNTGGPYSSCGDIHLNGSIANATTGTWSSTGSGTFDPGNTTLNATYHPSAADLASGRVTLILTTDAGASGCVAASSHTTATFTSTNDNNACTTDGCDQSTGIATHAPLNFSDNNACTFDACNSVTGPSHTPINLDDNNPCTNDLCNAFTGPYHTPINTNDGNACTTDGCITTTGIFHTPIDPTDGDACTTDACNSSTGVISHSPVNVDDGDPCTADGCNTATGVFHNPIPCNVTLTSSVYIQGFYSGSGLMDNFGAGGFMYVSGYPLAVATDVDFVSISAMDPTFPYGLVDAQTGILQTNGSISVTFGLAVVTENSYYLKVNHQNSVETWSAAPVILMPSTFYSFSSAASQAFGINLALTPDNLYYAIFNGDINQDGAVDGSDFLVLDPEIQNGTGGYVVFDLNGDGAVDGSDFLLLDPNIQIGVGAAIP